MWGIFSFYERIGADVQTQGRNCLIRERKAIRPGWQSICIFFVSLLFLIAANASLANQTRVDIVGTLSGSWYDPSRDGEGFILEFAETTSGKVAIVYWFTHLNGEPFWMSGTANYDRKAFDETGLLEFKLNEVSGSGFGRNFSSDELARAPTGQISFVFKGCNSAIAAYTPEAGGELLGRTTQEYSLNRITRGLDGLLCTHTERVPSWDGELQTLSGTATKPRTLSGAYRVNDFFKVSESVTVTVEPGTIFFVAPDARITVAGTLKAAGIQEDLVYFTCLTECPTGKTRSGRWRGIELIDSNDTELKYVLIEGAQSAITASGNSPFSLSNSIVRNNLRAIVDPGGYQTLDIQDNKFSKMSSVFSIRTIGETQINRNVFQEISGPIFTESFYFGTTSIRDNNFLIGSKLEEEYTLITAPQEGYGYGEIDARHNWWGTLDEAKIEAIIRDQNDDPSLTPLPYKPFKTGPHPNAGPKND
jgi:hypothetical protein